MPAIDVEFVFDRYLGDDGGLEVLPDLLLAHAPQWGDKLRICRSSSDARPLDVHAPAAFATGVLESAAARGETYAKLVETHGAGDDCGQGTAELRGAGPELTLVVSVDTHILTRSAGRGLPGNDIEVQVRSSKVAGKAAEKWVPDLFRDACARLSPAWAAAYESSEYAAKVMSQGAMIRAVGRDFLRSLPGIFWLNFFGSRYVEFIGRQRLLSAPARVEEVDGGVLVALDEHPADWTSTQRQQIEEAVRGAIGNDLFYSQDAPDRLTRAPSWSSL